MNKNKHNRSDLQFKFFFTVTILFCSAICQSQKVISLNLLLDSIQYGNPLGRMYDADIRSMDEAAKGAKS